MKAVNLKIMVFRHVTPCCVLRRNQRFFTHTLKKDVRDSVEMLVPNAKLDGVASKQPNLLLQIHT